MSRERVASYTFRYLPVAQRGVYGRRSFAASSDILDRDQLASIRFLAIEISYHLVAESIESTDSISREDLSR